MINSAVSLVVKAPVSKTRKQFTWSYRAPGMDGVKKKTKIGPNSSYVCWDFKEWDELERFRSHATGLLRERHEARLVSIHLKQQRLMEAA